MNNTAPQILEPDDAGIATAAQLLSQGALVAFPTETVYGLGADAGNDDAVAGIFLAKGRPNFNPLIVHVADQDTARRLCHWPDAADQLARHFWPGPLSFVLPLRTGHGLSPRVTAGLPTVAVRAPAQPTARALLQTFGGPVAAPSANPSGRISPTSADHVRDSLGNRLGAILDDGPCSVGLESTIINLDGQPSLLRAGGVTVEDIESVLGYKLVAPKQDKITSPGQMLSHYAPRARLRLGATSRSENEVVLGFGTQTGDLNLSPDGDLSEAAANLFDYLHRLDATGRPIAVVHIPDHGLGLAINDRLRRAAAPR